MSNDKEAKDISLCVNSQLAVSQESAAMIHMIERVAMSPDADINKLEKLLDMKERVFNKTAEIEFNSAMAKMQSDIPTIEKNGKIVVNGITRSTYAEYSDIMKVVKPIMKDNGFALMFKVVTSEKSLTVKGVLVHCGGHREETEMLLPTDTSGSKNSVQAIGSSTSYGKRYVACALLNIATGDDDDGQGGETIDAAKTLEIAKMLNGNKDLEVKILKYATVDAIHLIPMSLYADIISKLKNTKGVSSGK